MLKNIDPTTTIAWSELQNLFEQSKNLTLSELFENDIDRFDHFSCQLNDEFLVDFSKNFITQEIFGKLILLAEQVDLKSAIKAQFSGEKINITEGRAVLHTALRNRSNTQVIVDGVNVMPKINKVLAQMKKFCAQIHSGEWKGYTGKAITDIVNIGIGGSDLGPYMTTEALTP